MRAVQAEDVRRAEGVARRIATRHLRGRAWEGIGVEDVVQEVLLRFAQLDLDTVANVDAWVTTVAHNRCRDVVAAVLRHDGQPLGAGGDPNAVRLPETRRNQRTIIESVVGPSAAAISPMVLAYALEGLSAHERSILLRHAGGWSNADIASEFGYASPQSAAVAISRAKRKVRERFSTAMERRHLVDPQRVY